MKHLKTKLMASVSMLMVATVMLSSASFAWFTISTAPEVKEVSTNIASNGNLEIALSNGSDSTAPSESAVGDSKHNEAWGNTVDLTHAFQTTTDSKTTSNFSLKPVAVSWTKGVPTFTAPKFGNDGRIVSADQALNRHVVADVKSGDNLVDYGDLGGVFLYSTEDGTDALATTKNDSVWAYEIDYWFRTNSAAEYNTDGSVKTKTKIALTTAQDLGNGITGEGSWIQDPSITIRIVDGENVYAAVPAATATDGKYALTLKSADKDGKFTEDATIELDKNVAKLVKMYVFWAGEGMKNADFGTQKVENIKMAVQFAPTNTTLTSLLPEDKKSAE